MGAAAAMFVFAVVAGFVLTEPVAAGGGCRGMPVTTGEGTTVTMDDALCFTPTVLYVEPGEEVTWRNTGEAARHSVAGANIAWGNYETAGPGESVTLLFETPGTYSYYCFEHNGMIGTIVVGDRRPGVETASVAPVEADTPGDGSRWDLVTIGALTGMVATGAVGLALGRRRE